MLIATAIIDALLKINMMIKINNNKLDKKQQMNYY